MSAATILVVDDRALNRQYLATLLGYLGHSIVEAADGNEALAAMRSRRPALIITDIVMPGMDGVEFVRQVQADPATAAIPVIFYSATYRVPHARELAKGCRAAAVLPKPSDPEIIVAAVRAALGDSAAPASVEKRAFSGLNPGLVALMDFQCELAEMRDPGRVLELACRAAPNLIAAEYCVVGVEAAPDAVLGRLITRGLDEAAVFPAGAGVTDLFAERMNGTSGRRAWNPGGAPAALGLPHSHPPVRSLLVVPLAGITARHGWIYLANRENGLAFTAEDEELLGLLARQAAAAYENGLLHDQAMTDALTGLYTRRAFDAAFAREIARAARQSTALSLVFADLDHFKRCNDAHGHAGGDAVLRAVGAHLKQAVRGYDQVFRIGGEEFVILLPGSTAGNAFLRAEQIREGIKRLSICHGGRSMSPMTMSLGVAGYPAHGGSSESVLQAADEALYAAKGNGRDCTRCAPTPESPRLPQPSILEP